VAAGSYAEDVTIEGKPVRLWGRCPESVEIVGTGGEFSAVFVRDTGASTTEIHDLAVSGPAIGLVVSGAEGVVIDRVRVHDTGARAIDVEDTLGPTRVAI